ncbi:hypothetical protein [Ralstonia pseudosolanacearum]|uniref:hypothetical protein n=1 Tax=Ralstonia pseudosolanacearum TaxID=1310165 RepID=UPI003CF5777A
MDWNQKDSLDLVLMIVGTALASIFSICFLHFVFIPFPWAMFGGTVFAALGGYVLRWVVWRLGLRKHF